MATSEQDRKREPFRDGSICYDADRVARMDRRWVFVELKAGRQGGLGLELQLNAAAIASQRGYESTDHQHIFVVVGVELIVYSLDGRPPLLWPLARDRRRRERGIGQRVLGSRAYP
jgi:hypothetical protein